MAADHPNLEQIKTDFINSFESRFGVTATLLPTSFIRILSSVLAGAIYLVYKYTSSVRRQMFVSTASFDQISIEDRPIRPLVEWGDLIGVSSPKAATRTEMTVTITVLTQTGALLGGTPLVNTSTGVVYVTKQAVALNASTVNVGVISVSDPSGGDGSGSSVNMTVGQTLSFMTPNNSVAPTVSIASIQVTAADPETAEEYRLRVLDKFANRPQGGARADYRQWALTVEGIIGAWPYAGQPGWVDVYIEATVESSGDPDGIPTQAQLDAVEEAIEYDQNGIANRRPLGSLVTAKPIDRVVFNVAVSNVQGVADMASMQSDVEDALTEYFLSLEPFIAGLYTPVRRDTVTSAAVGGIVQEIVAAYNGVMQGVVVRVVGLQGLVGAYAPEDGAVMDKYVLSEGQKAKIGYLTWT